MPGGIAIIEAVLAQNFMNERREIPCNFNRSPNDILSVMCKLLTRKNARFFLGKHENTSLWIEYRYVVVLIIMGPLALGQDARLTVNFDGMLLNLQISAGMPVSIRIREKGWSRMSVFATPLKRKGNTNSI